MWALQRLKHIIPFFHCCQYEVTLARKTVVLWLRPLKLNSKIAFICACRAALCLRNDCVTKSPNRQMVMLVKENPLLVDVAALEKCYRVMDLLCEQCVKQQDMNEVLAMKMHYISCVLQKCLTFLQERDDKLDALVKR